MYHPEKLATYGTQKKKKHEHICAGYNYMHTNINTANKPSYKQLEEKTNGTSFLC
jgi:hypothetical protein